MRLGAPVFLPAPEPETWARYLTERGYRAAFCPVDYTAEGDTIAAYARAAERADIVIGEVGAWSNPIGPDERRARAAEEFCQRQLALADEIGARCCVNIAGSRGERWDGHHPDNLTPETFDLIVETTRRIIDAVRPTRSYFTLETMPWVFPHSPDSYLALIRAVDRERFAVHLDPVNLVTSPERYYANGALIRECFEKLGPHIKCCHAKDVTLGERFLVHLDETRPGTGNLDYRAYLGGLARLDPDTPLLIEHLANEEEYAKAAAHIRAVARELAVTGL